MQYFRSCNIAPGCPNLIERIEGGLLSYGNEMTRDNNPLEMGFGKFCELDGSVNYLGRAALQAIAQKGVDAEMRGVVFGDEPCPTCSTPWPVEVDGHRVGQITSAIYSPRLKSNVGLSLIDRAYWSPGQPVKIYCSNGTVFHGEVSALPFD